MHFTSLKSKLVVFISSIFILFFCVLIIGTAYYLRTTAINDAVSYTEKTTKEISLRIQREFEAGFSVARTLATTLEGLRAQNMMPSREQATEMLHASAVKNPKFFGIWTVWEPQGFGDDDHQYTSNAEHSGPDGRFVPYWNKTKGYLSLYPCKSYRDDEPSGWYTFSRDSKQEFATVITEFKPNGKSIKVTSLTVPVIVDGKAVGVIGADLSADFLNNIANSIKAFDGQATLAIIAHDGSVQALTHDTKALNTQYEKYVPNAAALLTQAASGKTVTSINDDYLRVIVPISLGKAEKNWAIALSVPKAVVLAEANSMTKLLAGASIATLILALLFIYYLAGFITKPIIHTSNIVEELASGKLNKRCVIRSHDEIATMQNAVNNLGETLEQNEQRSKESMEEIEAHSTEATKAMEAARLAQEEAEQAHSKGMLAAAKQLETVVSTLAGLSTELNEQITSTVNDITLQEARNSETATAMEEMNCTILEVAQNANHAATSTDEVCTKAEKGIRGITQSVETIQNVSSHTEKLKCEMNALGEQVTSISDIINVISDIADQTNLLALNAAIEAARAGDAGRGFAVVADEVRKLAENTMNATNQVSTAIENIQASANANIEAMNSTFDSVGQATEYVTESGKTFTQIMEHITSVTEQVRAIATATTQQSAASEEINQAVGEISQLASNTSIHMHEAQNATNNLTTLTNQLNQMITTLQNS
ncbi:methyl-accepting chemotaxis protein [Halodesulfovibrio aestuarii]|uniref:methyl-accepting chemotaxis protein n=1 Tax=Halodesulfovibrio aestuarii TaxID=126333 RepID=UPI0004249EA7